MALTLESLRLVRRSDETERTVRYGRRRRVERKLKTYDVFVSGAQVGVVGEVMATFESRTPGRMYVNYRWESPRWRSWVGSDTFGEGERYAFNHETRKRALAELLYKLNQPAGEA